MASQDRQGTHRTRKIAAQAAAAMLVATIVAAAPGAASAAVTREAEPNDSRATATGLLTSGHVVEGIRSTEEDQDWYAFYVGDTCDVTAGIAGLGSKWTWGYVCSAWVYNSKGEGVYGVVWDAASWKHRLTRGIYYVKADCSSGDGLEYGITVSGERVTVVRPSTPKAPATMSHKTGRTVSGTLTPRHEAGTAPVRIYKWRWSKSAKKWTAKGYVNAKVADYGEISKYSAKLKLGTAGRWRLRAFHPDAGSWSSGSDYVTVE